MNLQILRICWSPISLLTCHFLFVLERFAKKCLAVRCFHWMSFYGLNDMKRMTTFGSFWLCLAGCLVSIRWPHRPCCCDRFMTTVINTSTSLHLRQRCEQKPIGKTQHIYERRTHETKMDELNLRRCSTNSFQALHLPGKMYAFLVPPCQKTFLKTTEHCSTKTILSKRCRGKMNKLIRIERVNECDRGASAWNDYVIHEQKASFSF